jgi:hypothetical protein
MYIINQPQSDIIVNVTLISAEEDLKAVQCGQTWRIYEIQTVLYYWHLRRGIITSRTDYVKYTAKIFNSTNDCTILIL